MFHHRLEGIAFAADPEFNMPTSQAFFGFNKAGHFQVAECLKIAEILFRGQQRSKAGDFWTFPNFVLKKINSNHMKLTKWTTENGQAVLFVFPRFPGSVSTGRYTTSSPYAFRRLLPGHLNPEPNFFLQNGRC